MWYENDFREVVSVRQKLESPVTTGARVLSDFFAFFQLFFSSSSWKMNKLKSSGGPNSRFNWSVVLSRGTYIQMWQITRNMRRSKSLLIHTVIVVVVLLRVRPLLLRDVVCWSPFWKVEAAFALQRRLSSKEVEIMNRSDASAHINVARVRILCTFTLWKIWTMFYLLQVLKIDELQRD